LVRRRIREAKTGRKAADVGQGSSSVFFNKLTKTKKKDNTKTSPYFFRVWFSLAKLQFVGR